MSWRGVGGKPDPFAKPAKVGDRFGCFVVIDTALQSHPHYGIQAKVRCERCGFERVHVLAQLRWKPRAGHRGCKPT